jgi:hypothetical protein
MNTTAEIKYTEVHSADGARRWLIRVWDDEARAWRESGPYTYAERLEHVRRLREARAASDELRCVSDRYDADGAAYASVDEFLAMCRSVFGEAPELTRQADGWHDDRGPVLVSA